MLVSVVIATFNRCHSLLRVIDSLTGQTYPSDQFEVIVVDDGSTDGTRAPVRDAFPFPVRYYRQENAGATQARNTGALQSAAQILVFMDDDMVATPTLLECLIRDLVSIERVIVLATMIPVPPKGASPFGTVYARAVSPSQSAGEAGSGRLCPSNSRQDGAFVPFVECMTGLLAVTREDFMALGMFQDPTGGWPNWDDVDFGYRTHLQGFRIWRSHRALAYHHDRSLISLEASCARWEQAGRSAVRLFQTHPELQDEIPMFRDKAPISWKGDPLHLVANKVVRTCVSSSWSVSIMQGLVHILEEKKPDSCLLASLYRWIVSAFIYRGYREGLRDKAGGKRRLLDGVSPRESHFP